MKSEDVTTQETVEVYDTTSDVFEGVLREMRELSKRKPEAILNKRKVAIINRILDDLQSILKEEPEGKYLESLEEDDLPQNSDAVLVMVQYEMALKSFRRRYRNGYGGTWNTKERLEGEEEY